MAERQFNCPTPRPDLVPASMYAATLKMERAARRWRDLAERRLAHLLELYQSGRWKHYHTEAELLIALRGAEIVAKRWAEIAPDRDAPARDAPPAPVVASPRKAA